MRVVLKRGNDQIVSLVGLKSTEDDAFLNEATVTATLRDSRQQVVQPYQNVPMAYVMDSQGDYEWYIDGSQMMLPKGVEYSLEIKAEQAGLNYRVVHVVSVIDG